MINVECIVIIIAVAAACLFFGILIGIAIFADKPKQQDDHDYSDQTKILGGTCNWDEEQDK